EISSYNSELYRRMSLRFLYEFELAYCYMKDFVIKYTSRSKGMKSTTQINALLTGRITLQQLLNIENTTSETFLVHQPIKQKKKKLVTLDEISINIPGFVGKVSARKLKTFTTAGPRLVELLKALNDNWVILDLVDYTTITWLANIKKDEWIELIHQITSNS
ncbi:18649_t:CDS:1, partial [Gigaspora rosea]